MEDDIIPVWEDLVAKALKELASDSPTWGAEAIVQADCDLKRINLEVAKIMFKVQILETKIHNNLNGKKAIPKFTEEEMYEKPY